MSSEGLGVSADMCVSNYRWCPWGAKQRVGLAQTWERGPPLVPAEICSLFVTLSLEIPSPSIGRCDSWMLYCFALIVRISSTGTKAETTCTAINLFQPQYKYITSIDENALAGSNLLNAHIKKNVRNVNLKGTMSSDIFVYEQK
jgi:hypothetical protein